MRLRAGPFVLAITVAVGCARPHTYGPPEPVEPNPWCARVRPDRARVKGLLHDGKLGRAIRVMQRVEANCPEDAELTWADRVTALADIGRSAEARQLAGIIDDSPRSTPADKKAAAAARDLAALHEARPPSIERAQAEAAIELRRAVEAGARYQNAEREAHALASYKLYRPNVRALVEAGLAARGLGRSNDAQRYFDRAAFDDPASPIRADVNVASPLDEGASALAFSRDGRELAAAALGFVHIIEVEGLQPERRIAVEHELNALAFSADGASILAGLADGRVRELDVLMGAAGREISTGESPVAAIVIAPDGKSAAILRQNATIAFVDLASGMSGTTAHVSATQIAYRPDGRALAWANAKEIGLVDPTSGKSTPLPRPRGEVRALTFSSATDLDVLTKTEHLRLDVDKKNGFRTIKSKLTVERAAASTNGFALLSHHAFGPYRAADTENQMTGIALEDEPTAIAVAPDGATSAIAYASRRLERVDAPFTRRLHQRDHEGPHVVSVLAAPPAIESLSAPRDGSMLAIGAASGDVALVAIPSGKTRSLAVDVGAHARVAISGDGKQIAAAGQRGEIHFLGASKSRFVAGGSITALAYAPDNEHLAFGGRSNQVRFSDADASHTKILDLDGGDVRALAFSPGGEKVLIAAGPGLTLWDLASDKGERYTAFGRSPRAIAWENATSFAVSRSDSNLAFGAVGNPKPTLVVPLLGSPFGFYFSGSQLVVAESDGSVAIRNPPGKVLERLREPHASAKVVIPLGSGFAAGMNDGSVRIFLPGKARAVAMIWPSGAVITSPDGHVDANSLPSSLVCRLGAVAYPFEVCAEQFIVNDLLGVAMAGRDPAEADP